MMKKFFKKISLIVISIIFPLLSPISTFALDASMLETFSQNDILFYDPSESKCYSGRFSGNTIMAKVVSYLKGNNPSGFVLSDEAIAGILANFQGESGFNPFRFQNDRLSGPAYGIAQFDPMSKITDKLKSDDRTSSYFNEYFDLKYTYYDTETGFPKESIPQEVIDAWLAVQLDFFFGPDSEFENTKVGSYRNLGGTMGLDYISSSMTVHEAMDNIKSAEDAARLFVWIMERPADKPGASNRRAVNVPQWLELSRSMSPASGAGSSTKSNGSDVTIIGDSITVGSESQIKELLPNADIHAQVSKQFGEGSSDNPGGLKILKELVDEKKLRNIVVFALGTNTNGVKEEDVKKVVELAGSNRKVIFTTNYTTSNSYDGNNNNFRKANQDNQNVLLADWRSAVESKEDKYLAGDGIHPNEQGRELFANIISNAVNEASNFRGYCGGAVNGGLTEEQAQRLADYYNAPANVRVSDWELTSSIKANCTSFSQWFTMYFTGLKWGFGNGKDSAHYLAVKHGLEEGNEPRPYSVFSVTQGIADCGGFKCGHTGIVVAVDDDKITTVEASYNLSYDAEVGNARVYHSDWSTLKNAEYGYVFTYIDSLVDKAKLEEIVNSAVNR